MTDEELVLYSEAMHKGQYLLGASIVLAAQWREEELERAKREQERKEYYDKLRLLRPELFVK